MLPGRENKQEDKCRLKRGKKRRMREGERGHAWGKKSGRHQLDRHREAGKVRYTKVIKIISHEGKRKRNKLT